MNSPGSGSVRMLRPVRRPGPSPRTRPVPAIARGLQVGIVYAVWSSLGTTLIVLVGALFLNEPLTLAKVTGVALVIAGVVILNLGGAH